MTVQIVAPGLADGPHVYGPFTIDFANGVAEVDDLDPGVQTYMLRKGYKVGAPGEIPEEDEQGGDVVLFDPSEHKVEEVLEYLATLDGDDEEVLRIRDAERAGKARRSVLEAIEGTPEIEKEVSADGA